MAGGEQLDLFAGSHESAAAVREPAPFVDTQALGDAALIDALPRAGMRHSLAIVHEIARRRLASGVPVLAGHCRKLAGFRWSRLIDEQTEAVKALGIVGGREASEAIARLIADHVFDGPGLGVALAEAVRLGSALPEQTVASFLRADDPALRAAAARCVRIWPNCAPLLIELMEDLHEDVRLAAACALGRIGNGAARPLLLKALRERPSPEVVDAIAGIPDRDVIVFLGRAGAARPDLAGLIRDVLEGLDLPQAALTAKRLQP